MCQEPGVRRRVGGCLGWDMVGMMEIVRVYDGGSVEMRWEGRGGFYIHGCLEGSGN